MITTDKDTLLHDYRHQSWCILGGFVACARSCNVVANKLSMAYMYIVRLLLPTSSDNLSSLFQVVFHCFWCFQVGRQPARIMSHVRCDKYTSGLFFLSFALSPLMDVGNMFGKSGFRRTTFPQGCQRPAGLAGRVLAWPVRPDPIGQTTPTRCTSIHAC